MTLAALVCDLDGAHHRREGARLFPVPAVRDAIKQAGTVSVAAAGRVDNSICFDAGDLDDFALCMDARTFGRRA